MDIKDDYIVQNEKDKANLIARIHNYHMGIRAGLHQTVSLEKLLDEEQLKDQTNINRAVQKAKLSYQKNYTTSKEFEAKKSEIKSIIKSKHKELDKG